MSIITVHNPGIPRLRACKRCWCELGDVICLGPAHHIQISSERNSDGGPRTLLLVVHSPRGRWEVRRPESLGYYTTDALVRAVEFNGPDVQRVLMDVGPLVLAPAVSAAP